MSFDVHSLEGYSTIASVSGSNPNLTIVVQTGDGSKFGNPQNVTIWPANTQPTIANSTIGRISNISSNTLTVTTAQEGSSNITVAAGMQISNTITPKVLTDVETLGQLSGGYAQITTSATTTNTSATAVTGLSISVTMPSVGRGIWLTVHAPGLYNSVAADNAKMTLWDGVVGSGTQLDYTYGIQGGGSASGGTCMAVVTPSAGASKTYAVGIQCGTGATTTTLECYSIGPAFILGTLI